MNWWRCLSSEQETPCFLLEKNMMMIMNHSRAISWESNIICHKNEHLGCRMENQFSSLLNHPSFISHLSWAALASYTINFWSSWKSMRLCCCSKIKFGSICYLPNKERRGPCHIFSCMVTWPCSLELDKHWWMLLFFFKKISSFDILSASSRINILPLFWYVPGPFVPLHITCLSEILQHPSPCHDAKILIFCGCQSCMSLPLISFRIFLNDFSVMTRHQNVI